MKKKLFSKGLVVCFATLLLVSTVLVGCGSSGYTSEEESSVSITSSSTSSSSFSFVANSSSSGDSTSIDVLNHTSWELMSIKSDYRTYNQSDFSGPIVYSFDDGMLYSMFDDTLLSSVPYSFEGDRGIINDTKPVVITINSDGELEMTVNMNEDDETVRTSKKLSSFVSQLTISTNNTSSSSSTSSTAKELTPAEEYKKKCKFYDYKKLARDPEDYIGKYAKFYGQVLQEQSSGNTVVLRVATKKSEYSKNYYDNVIYVTYSREANESRILGFIVK